MSVAENGSNLPPMVGAVIYGTSQHEGADREPEPADPAPRLRGVAVARGDEILERFNEEGESAKSTDRSQLQNLLTYCRLNRGRVHFVVVFNLTRFARDKYDHFALRSHLQSLGISLRSAARIHGTSTGEPIRACTGRVRPLRRRCARTELRPEYSAHPTSPQMPLCERHA